MSCSLKTADFFLVNKHTKRLKKIISPTSFFSFEPIDGESTKPNKLSTQESRRIFLDFYLFYFLIGNANGWVTS